MSIVKLIGAGVAMIAVVYTAYAIVSLRSELSRSRGEIERLAELNRTLTQQLFAAQTLGWVESADVPACEPAQPAECPDVETVFVTPDGEPASDPAEREVYVRSYFEDRLARAELPGLGRAQRAMALELLLEIRALRTSGGSPRQLRDAQQALIDLTGMGVGELLEEMELSAARSHRPANAPPVEDGELRKRFKDETARRMGIVKPESVERYVDGVWQPTDP